MIPRLRCLVPTQGHGLELATIAMTQSCSCGRLHAGLRCKGNHPPVLSFHLASGGTGLPSRTITLRTSGSAGTASTVGTPRASAL